MFEVNALNERDEIHRKDMQSDKEGGERAVLCRISSKVCAIASRAGPDSQRLQPDELQVERIEENRPGWIKYQAHQGNDPTSRICIQIGNK